MGRTKCKRIIAIISVLCLFVMIFIIVLPKKSTAIAEVGTGGEISDLNFLLNSDKTGYSVRAKNRRLTQAIIPSYYEGLPVTEIGSNAFASCTTLISVTIPNSVTKIGNNAFLGCVNLMSVKGMAGVVEIGSTAFSRCEKLFNLNLPNCVQTIGRYAFRNTGKLVDEVTYEAYRQQSKDEKEPGYNLLRQ